MLGRLTSRLRLLGRDRGGGAAVEFALASLLLVLAVLNAIDFGYYMYQRMEVEYAAQVGAQAAWKTCYDTSAMLPATRNCAGLNNAITAAIQSTSLGTNLALATGSPAEAYYCVNTSGALQSVGTVAGGKPANCSTAGNAAATPGDYLQVAVTYPYASLFPGVSAMGLWGVSSISMTAWMRMG
jgi:Flp pilus assembly protein TadG